MFRLFKKKTPKETAEADSQDQNHNEIQKQDQNISDEATLEQQFEPQKTDPKTRAEASSVNDSTLPEAPNSLISKKNLEQTSTQEVPENHPDVLLDDSIISDEKSRDNTQSAQTSLIISEATQSSNANAGSNTKHHEKSDKKGVFGRLRAGLSKTGSSITEGMGTLVLGKKKIDDDVLEELETRLLMADVGMDATMRIVNNLTHRTKRHELTDMDALSKAMYDEMTDILRPVAKPLEIQSVHKPMVILMVGINGAGKTTTIGKLAKKFQNQGKSVMLAAGDTFRAAAVEQLQIWGERNNIPVIAQGTGSDSASVIYDAMESAKARNIDVLLADTAGRLHTQTNLMEELKKVKRVMQKIDPSAPHEIMLVVDASIGQNALAQAREFNNALDLTGITVTKLDGTAKGGILFAIAEQTGIPVRFIGVGESIDDLQVFDAYEFAGALLAEA